MKGYFFFEDDGVEEDGEEEGECHGVHGGAGDVDDLEEETAVLADDGHVLDAADEPDVGVEVVQVRPGHQVDEGHLALGDHEHLQP